MKKIYQFVCLMWGGLLLGGAGLPASAQTFRWVRTGTGPRAQAQVSALAVANSQLTATGVFRDVVAFDNQSF